MISSVRMQGVVLLSLVLAMGCAHIPKEAGFGDVQRLVGERVDHRLHWNRGSAEDDRVAEAIDKLLAEELSADAAVQIALLNNGSLQASYDELGITQADVVQAGLLENPVFMGRVRFPHAPPSVTNLEFDVAQDFLSLLMLPARKRLAAAQFEQTKLHVATEVLKLAIEVEKAYYELLGAKSVAALRRLVVETGEASYDMARRLHGAGNLSDLNLSNERGQYEQARVMLAKSEAKVLTVRERLTRLMGLWGRDRSWEVPGRLPDLPRDEIPLEHLESLAIANRLDLGAARQEVKVFAEALGISRDFRWIAAAELGVSSERDTDGQWVTGPALTLELPLFDQHQAKLARQEAQLRQSQNRLIALAVSIRSEVRSLRNDLLTARYLVEHYKTVIIPLRERIVKLTQEEYNYMLAGVFELLMAKLQELDAYQEYLEAVRDYWMTRAELRHAVGGRLPPSVRDASPGAQPANSETVSTGPAILEPSIKPSIDMPHGLGPGHEGHHTH
jgi:outer membrane protein, heavy metal efflux system